MAVSRRSARESQGVLLIWLDSNINEESSDCHKTITEFRRVIDNVKMFIDADECIEYVADLHDAKTFVIISGSLGQRLVPLLHDLTQITWIFVFCGDRKRHEQWAKEWKKIKGVFTEISPLCDALNQASEDFNKDRAHIEIPVSTGVKDNFLKAMDALDHAFVYTYCLNEVFLSIDFDKNDFQDFIDYCRQIYDGNVRELKNIQKFQNEYRHHTPIWWYTWESFLYRIVNHSLRMVDVKSLIRMGFYMVDLHRQIEQLHFEQFKQFNNNERFIVYRGQVLGAAEFESISKSKGGIISFNNFLSTSKNREISLEFGRSAASAPDRIGILFVMTIDPSLSTTPFALIDHLNYDQEKDEILFSMHMAFRVGCVKPLDENHRLFQVDLSLLNSTDVDGASLINIVREEMKSFPPGWHQVPHLMMKMGNFDGAEQAYQIVLNRIPDMRERGKIYYQLGLNEMNRNRYQQALAYYEQAVPCLEKTLLLTHPRLADLYKAMSLAYEKMGQYIEAVKYGEKALKIYQKTLPPDHPDLARSYSNMGVIYSNLGDIPHAISSHERALEIGQRSLPANHPDLELYQKNLDKAKKK